MPRRQRKNETKKPSSQSRHTGRPESGRGDVASMQNVEDPDFEGSDGVPSQEDFAAMLADNPDVFKQLMEAGVMVGADNDDLVDI